MHEFDLRSYTGQCGRSSKRERERERGGKGMMGRRVSETENGNTFKKGSLSDSE